MIILIIYNRHINKFDKRLLRSHKDVILFMVHKLDFVFKTEEILNPETYLISRVSNEFLLTWILIFEIHEGISP